ncbi:MAG TPA: malate synthase A, partial [Bacteroidota bacterium]|nr:malate synthase A [Bacteroidota bacterium]
KHRLREEVSVSARDLLDFRVEGGQVTEAGLRNNINVALQYLAAWLGGQGAVGIFNLMEDAATAEISRSQVWQWLHHRGVQLADGRAVTPELYRAILPDELRNVEKIMGTETFQSGRFQLAMRLFNHLVMQRQFTEFLTIEAYRYLDGQ